MQRAGHSHCTKQRKALAMDSAKRKRQSFTVEQKVDVIKLIEQGLQSGRSGEEVRNHTQYGEYNLQEP